MTRSAEVAQAEAVQALATRLEAWGVDDALAKATEYVHDMVREGWRPRGPREVLPPEPKGPRTPAELATDYLQARAALRGTGVPS